MELVLRCCSSILFFESSRLFFGTSNCTTQSKSPIVRPGRMFLCKSSQRSSRGSSRKSFRERLHTRLANAGGQKILVNKLNAMEKYISNLFRICINTGFVRISEGSSEILYRFEDRERGGRRRTLANVEGSVRSLENFKLKIAGSVAKRAGRRSTV